MSPKGTQPLKEVSGSQAVLKPFRPCSILSARPTQAPAPCAIYAPATEGLIPEGRKKFVSAESTQGAPPEVNPHPVIANGLVKVWPAAKAVSKFCTIRSPRMVLALMG